MTTTHAAGQSWWTQDLELLDPRFDLALLPSPAGFKMRVQPLAWIRGQWRHLVAGDASVFYKSFTHSIGGVVRTQELAADGKAKLTLTKYDTEKGQN